MISVSKDSTRVTWINRAGLHGIKISINQYKSVSSAYQTIRKDNLQNSSKKSIPSISHTKPIFYV